MENKIKIEQAMYEPHFFEENEVEYNGLPVIEIRRDMWRYKVFVEPVLAAPLAVKYAWLDYPRFGLCSPGLRALGSEELTFTPKKPIAFPTPPAYTINLCVDGHRATITCPKSEDVVGAIEGYCASIERGIELLSTVEIRDNTLYVTGQTFKAVQAEFPTCVVTHGYKKLERQVGGNRYLPT